MLVPPLLWPGPSCPAHFVSDPRNPKFDTDPSLVAMMSIDPKDRNRRVDPAKLLPNLYIVDKTFSELCRYPEP